MDSHRLTRLLLAVVGATVLAVAGWVVIDGLRERVGEDTDVLGSSGDETPTPTSAATPSATPEPSSEETGEPTGNSSDGEPTPEAPADPSGSSGFEPVAAESVGQPFGETVAGVTTFRGNPTRTYYGATPVPAAPVVRWAYPAEGGMCGPETDDGQACGTGWTGQPAVFERGDATWAVFGAFDGNVHFVDARSGVAVLAPFATGDAVKGSVTIDPDGFALAYVGSNDGTFRILAFDRPEVTELWSFDALDVEPTYYSDDWDASPLILGDLLFQGGENGQFLVVKLARSTDADGLATVNPELIFNTPSWDDELLEAIDDENLSVETSPSAFGSTVYFANSGGLVQGWDMGPLSSGGTPERVFRFWTGDDSDASIVIDEEGALYVGSTLERENERAAEVGQLIKLDPADADDPVVWSLDDGGGLFSGFLATPALHGDLLIATTTGGRLLGIDRNTGDIRWEKQLTGPTWSSPVVVDDVLLQADCAGLLHAYDLSGGSDDPPELWAFDVGGCLESTPVVFDGAAFIGSREGRFFALADN